MQEQIIEIERGFDDKSKKRIEAIEQKCALTMKNATAKIESLTSDNTTLSDERDMLNSRNLCLQNEESFLKDRVKKSSRTCMLLSILSLVSVAALGLDTSGNLFAAQISDKQTTIQELQDDLKEATAKKRIATRNIESLEKKVERLENEKIKKIEAEKVKKTKKAAVSKRKKNVDKICTSASECTFDAKADNVIHCSVYQKGTRYRCSVILNERVTGYHREGRTVTLADGHASVWSNSSMFRYSVAKIGSRY